MTWVAAKSVCGSSAEWGRAQLKGASHPLSSLMDQHHLHDHLQDHAGDAVGDCIYQPEGRPRQKSTWGFFWIYKIVSFCCFTQHMTFKSVGEPDQRRAHYKAAAKKKEQYCSPLYSTQCTQQRERERERAQKRRAACRKSLSTHRCTEEAGGCREK